MWVIQCRKIGFSIFYFDLNNISSFYCNLNNILSFYYNLNNILSFYCNLNNILSFYCNLNIFTIQSYFLEFYFFFNFLFFIQLHGINLSYLILIIYAKLYGWLFNRLIVLLASGPGDRGSIPGRIIPEI